MAHFDFWRRWSISSEKSPLGNVEFITVSCCFVFNRLLFRGFRLLIRWIQLHSPPIYIIFITRAYSVNLQGILWSYLSCHDLNSYIKLPNYDRQINFVLILVQLQCSTLHCVQFNRVNKFYFIWASFYRTVVSGFCCFVKYPIFDSRAIALEIIILIVSCFHKQCCIVVTLVYLSATAS